MHPLQAASKLWRAGIRCCVRHRAEKDRQTLCRVLTARRYHWLLEGSKLVFMSQKTQTIARNVHDRSIGSLGLEARDVIVGATAGSNSRVAAASGRGGSGGGSPALLPAQPPVFTSWKVEFVGKEDSSSVQRARDQYMHHHASTPTIVAVTAKSDEVRATISDYLAGRERPSVPGGSQHAQLLLDYFRRNQTAFAPVYSMMDGGMEFVAVHTSGGGKQRRRKEDKGRN